MKSKRWGAAVAYRLREDLLEVWGMGDPFPRLSSLDGEVYRHKEGRRTLRFSIGERGYFLKLHQGVGWREIFKNLVQLRLPVVGARNEWRAIGKMAAIGIDSLTIAGFGERGRNPARRQSFLITDELVDVESLEDYCRSWQAAPPEYRCKKILVERIAAISRQLHRGGVNHRDYYLCHFMLPRSVADDWRRLLAAPIYLMDLHRAQIRRQTPRRWLIKDLGALYYSSMDIGLTRRDVLRFIRCYTGQSAARVLRTDARFWRSVRRRARAIYRRDFGHEPTVPL